MAKREPLLDTEWLLGSPDTPGRWWRRFISQSCIALFLVLIGVGVWPSLSRSWLQNQLLEQYRTGESDQARNDAMISLAEMLPQSLSIVVAGLSKPNPSEAHLAYEALDYFIGQITTLPIDQRRGNFAELIHALEEVVPSLRRDSALLASALAARVSAVQQSDQHPGTLMTIAACQRIFEGKRSQAPASLASFATLSDTLDSKPNIQLSHPPSATASFSNTPTDEKLVQPGALIKEVAIVDTTQAPVRMSLNSGDESELGPPAFENAKSFNSVANASQLKQKLLRANRYVPAEGNLSVPVQSSNVKPLEGMATVATNESATPLLKTSATATRSTSDEEEVIGIGRQLTEDLIRLLGSVQPRVANAAFHELQRSRLNQKELAIAVELAQGTTEQRLQAMERLAKESDLNPIMWLTWMGSEADRDVRFKAVSLLGSMNSEDARLKLRLMHSRERDAAISRHIQSALLASGAIKPHIR